MPCEFMSKPSHTLKTQALSCNTKERKVEQQFVLEIEDNEDSQSGVMIMSC